jgi:hypothetical protein
VKKIFFFKFVFTAKLSHLLETNNPKKKKFGKKCCFGFYVFKKVIKFCSKKKMEKNILYTKHILEKLFSQKKIFFEFCVPKKCLTLTTKKQSRKKKIIFEEKI